MKIESSKTNQAQKNDAAPTDKSETSFRSAFKPAEKLDSPPNGGFAKVLEETKNQPNKDKDSLSERKTDRAAPNTKTADAKKDSKTDGNVPSREKAEEKNKKDDGDRQQSGEQSENLDGASFIFQAAAKPASETATAPAARSILHVADLERIVSMIRTQTLKDTEQVVIALKHSILEGLQIKLTIDEQGTLKAEFLALNEQIKNQITRRKQEITRILHERGVKVSDLQVRQGSEFTQPTKHLENGSSNGKTSSNETVDASDPGKQTDYSI